MSLPKIITLVVYVVDDVASRNVTCLVHLPPSHRLARTVLIS
jgi:hypothetical protein